MTNVDITVFTARGGGKNHPLNHGELSTGGDLNA